MWKCCEVPITQRKIVPVVNVADIQARCEKVINDRRSYTVLLVLAMSVV